MAAPLKDRLARQASGMSLLTFDPTGRDEPQFAVLPIVLIDPDPHQPRRDLGELADLALSIRTHGVLNPIIVEPQPGGRYRILAGERRFTASRSLGLKEIPCLLRTVEDQARLELQLIENMHRKGLDPLEEARGLRRLLDDFNLTQKQLALRLGKSEASICQTLRILDLPEPTLEALQDGPALSKSVLLEIAKEAEPARQREMIQQSREGTLTVRKAREGKTTAKPTRPEPVVLRLTGCTVTVRFQDGEPSPERVADALRKALGAQEHQAKPPK